MRLNRPKVKAINRNHNKAYSKEACKKQIWLDEYFEEIIETRQVKEYECRIELQGFLNTDCLLASH